LTYRGFTSGSRSMPLLCLQGSSC